MAIRTQTVGMDIGQKHGQSVSIFKELFARAMHTMATELIVVEKIGLSQCITTSDGKSKKYEGRFQIFIDNTPYFLDPEREPEGISNMVIPDKGPQLLKTPLNIVITPGKKWDLKVELDTKLSQGDTIRASVKYVLYDGTDNILALELMEQHIPINIQNIDSLRRQLIEDDARRRQIKGLCGSDGTAPPEGSIELSPDLKLPSKAMNDVWMIYGKRGSGKTYFAKKVLEQVNKLGVPFIIIDTKRAYDDFLRTKTDSATFDELRNAFATPTVHRMGTETISGHPAMLDAKSVVQKLGYGESFIFNWSHLTADQQRVMTTEICNALSESNFGPTYDRPAMLVIDNCHQFIGQRGGNRPAKCNASVLGLIETGRSIGVGIMLISQSITNVASSARRKADINIYFGIRDSHDLSKISDTIRDKIYYLNVGEFLLQDCSGKYISDSGLISSLLSDSKED